ERDVLLGLPGNRLGQLGLAHARQRQPLDDHRVARERGGDASAAQAERIEQAAHGFADGGRLGGGAVLETALRNRRPRGGNARPAGPPGARDDSFAGTRTNAEPDGWRTEGSAEIHSGLL